MKRDQGMTTEQVESRVRKSFEAATPDVLTDVMSTCREKKGNNMENIITIQPPKRRSSRARLTAVIAAAAAFIFIFAAIIGFSISARRDKTFVTVQLDVNPGIEIRVDKNERVLKVIALNNDASKLIADMDFSGSTIEVAVNAIVGSMLKNGYLSEIANSILVSVEGNNEEASALLQQRLTDEINSMLNAAAFNGAVLSQTITPGDEELEKLSKEYGITHGKARLILAIIDTHPTYRFEDLVQMNITDLNLLAAGHALPGFDKIGTPENSNYIGTEQARHIAIDHAGIEENDLIYIDCELEYDDGRMLYDVEFQTKTMEYEYKIDAKDGSILDAESEPNEHGHGSLPSSYISRDEAIEIALKRAGIARSEAMDLDCELEYGDGISVYEIDFETSSMEYECILDASTGDILKWNEAPNAGLPYNSPTVTPNSPTATPTAGFISEKRAKEIVFSHAGIKEADVRGLEIDFDADDGIYLYEIEFECGSYEYEYEVNAISGKIIHHDKEFIGSSCSNVTPRPSDNPVSTPGSGSVPAAGQLSWRDAVKYALKHAGVSESELLALSIEYEPSGIKYFKIDFDTRSHEYEYKINATNGSVITSKNELNDDCDIPKGSYISVYKAFEYALKAVEVSSCSDRDIAIELDCDDGSVCYEVEFQSGRTEYSIQLHAITGAIIEIEME